MTSDEFRDWFDYHKAAFTGIADWLAKVTRGPESPTVKQVLSSWYRALRDIGIADAKRATDAMHSGSEEEPKGYDRHPAKVAWIARKLTGSRCESRPTYHIGQRTVACLDCMDDGWVHCWHPVDLQKLKTGSEKTDTSGCAVPCHCSAGDKRVPKGCRGEWSRYSQDKWLRIDFIRGEGFSTAGPEHQAIAIEWLKQCGQRHVESSPGYESAFAEHGGDGF